MGAGLDASTNCRQRSTEIGAPAILKTLRLGYDGKGQVRIRDAAEAEAAWAEIGERPAILEGFVQFSHEFSIILGARRRRRDGQLSAAVERAQRRHPRALVAPRPGRDRAALGRGGCA